ncbi:uncharacterized protein CLUP02_11454 [Colletotrichum lupini]|uniref:Uncharacterized protein n=1 Tax=Colletotrichum lupini TaxID=145971 RepID=A0A9Q8WKH3_9PEZI|nr:uncharacterized protein CLUP02_11454 [Colletotrichum lupini]UQC85955.1 hypothetical protein CLUP02_11454 [Colletotrichum lupini]
MSLNAHDEQAMSAVTRTRSKPQVTKQPKYTIAENSMYKKKLKEWHIFNHESSSQSQSRMDGLNTPLVKRRRCAGAKPRILADYQSGAAFSWRTHDLVLDWPTAELKALACMLYSIGNYLMGLFDQSRPGETSSGWKVNSFGLTPPQGHEDNSTEWKAIADQCHGASTLISQGNGTQKKCQITLLNILKSIYQLAQQEDPWIPRNNHLVRHVISSLAGLFIIRKGSSMMVDCLNSLRVFSLDRMKLANERVFGFCTDSFPKLPGGSHPVVLIMVARFLRYWPAALADHVLPNYGTLVARSGTDFGSSDERTIFFLTEYMYVAYYHGHNITLTYQLASDLCQRSEELGPIPQWGHGCLTPLAEKLRNGGRDCQTRALQIRRMMAYWSREAGNRERAQEQRGYADEIFNSMRELGVEQGN